jgi:hypothetical protein
MEQQSELVERYQSLYRELRPELLDRLEMWIDQDKELALQATVVLRSAVPSEARRGAIHMQGVIQMQLCPGVMPPRLHLDIQSIAHQQWEDAKYKIIDSEQDNDIHILCKDVKVDVFDT